MPLTDFQKKLQDDLKKRVKLTIKDNRSTMLSVKWEPHCTKVSLHKFFEEAPENVMESLACYIKQEEKNISPQVKSFIEVNMRKLDYTHKLKRHQISVEGKFYNLKTLYDAVNQEYFENSVDLTITWYGNRNQKNRSQITFGLYHEPLKLIKINRLLDCSSIPEFFVSYVIYHEMLHFVCPSYYDEEGRHRIHNREFKEKEMLFKYYHLAQDWIKKNRDRLFKQRRKYGWT